MLITFEEAKQIAIAKIGPNCAIVESATREKPYGWYFVGQSRKYLETGDFLEMLVGSGGFLIEREGGRVITFASAISPEKSLENYEKGFKYSRYDLTITAVLDRQLAVDQLASLDMTFVIPEEDNGTIWVIPQRYTKQQIEVIIEKLPATFINQAFWHRVPIFDNIKRLGCLKYELREHVEEPKR